MAKTMRNIINGETQLEGIPSLFPGEHSRIYNGSVNNQLAAGSGTRTSLFTVNVVFPFAVNLLAGAKWRRGGVF